MAHNPTKPVSRKGDSLLARLLQDKIIVPDPYYVPDDTPYFHEANIRYGHVIEICNPTDHHFNRFPTFDYVSVRVNSWNDMDDGRAPYAKWNTFKEWIIEAMSQAQYMTEQAVAALREIISYMEKNV